VFIEGGGQAPQYVFEVDARVAAIHDEIAAMPMGYHSLSATWAPASLVARSSA
jgi:hypothetical protein